MMVIFITDCLVLFNIVQFSNSPCNATASEQGTDINIKSLQCDPLSQVSATPSQNVRRRGEATRDLALRDLESAVSVSKIFSL